MADRNLMKVTVKHETNRATRRYAESAHSEIPRKEPTGDSQIYRNAGFDYEHAHGANAMKYC
jgi:hypothetical protein